jgi:hypothetical protein
MGFTKSSPTSLFISKPVSLQMESAMGQEQYDVVLL